MKNLLKKLKALNLLTQFQEKNLRIYSRAQARIHKKQLLAIITLIMHIYRNIFHQLKFQSMISFIIVKNFLNAI